MLIKTTKEQDKPIAISMSTEEIATLYHCGVTPDKYNQLLLAKFKDAGAPVEGMDLLKLAHGKIAKVKTDPNVEQDAFEYIWLPESYVYAIANAPKDGIHC